MTRKARRILFTLGLLVLLFVLGATWFFMAGPGSRGERPPSTYGIHEGHPGDLQAGLDLLDNVKNYGLPQDLPYKFSTNRLGFRGSEPSSKGSPSVLVLGDSFVFGMGVNDEETFPHQLEAALRANGYPQAVVHNGGVPGYTITDLEEQWAEKLSEFSADWVILCHNGSDLKEMARPYSLRRMMRFDSRNPERDDAEIRRLVEETGGRESAIRRHFIFREDDLWNRLGRDAKKAIELRDQYTAGVLRLATQVRSKGARFVTVLWVRQYTLGGIDVAPVRDSLMSQGIPVFEGEVAMHSQTGIAPGALYLPDRHFSPAGNGLAGQQTADWIIREMKKR
jgi:hypothetical protein